MQRLSMQVMTASAILVIAGVLVYLEFGLDFRTPRTALAIRGVVMMRNGPRPEQFAAETRRLTAKYGPRVEIWQGPASMTATLDGKIVNTTHFTGVYLEMHGLTQVADAGGAISIFPIHWIPDSLNYRNPALVATLKQQFAPILPANSVDDLDADAFSISDCRAHWPRELKPGFAASVLGLGTSTTCVITWRHLPFRRLLIGAIVAKGAPWIRPFARGACRLASNAWLANGASRQAGERPDYVQCLLVDRAANNRGEPGISTFVYEVRNDGSLARFEPGPVTLEASTIAPGRVPTFSQNTEARRAQH